MRLLLKTDQGHEVEIASTTDVVLNSLKENIRDFIEICGCQFLEIEVKEDNPVCTCGEEVEAFATMTYPQHDKNCPKYGRSH